MYKIITLSCIILFSGCTEQLLETEIEQKTTPFEKMESDILSMVNGSIVDYTIGDARGTLYTFKVEVEHGSIIYFEYSASGSRVQIYGISPSFDYQLSPAKGLYSFSAVKKIAFERVPGDMISWRLKLNKNEEWEYRFYINEGERTWDVKIDALSGTIISVN